MTKFSLLDQYVEIVYSTMRGRSLLQVVLAHPQQRVQGSVQLIAYPHRELERILLRRPDQQQRAKTPPISMIGNVVSEQSHY